MGRSRAAPLALLGLALLIACDRDVERATGPAAEAYFPMLPGMRWVYSLRSNLGSLEIEVTAVGPKPLPGGRGDVFVMEERNRGPSLGFVEVSPVGYVIRDAYFARLSAIDYDASGGLRLLGQEEPAFFLPLDPQPGYAWSQETRMFQTPEGGGGALGWSGEVKPRTRVTVPAGRFEDVVEIETFYRDPSEGIEPKILYHDFYARGIGLVKSITEDPSGNAFNRIEQQLLEVHFPR